MGKVGAVIIQGAAQYYNIMFLQVQLDYLPEMWRVVEQFLYINPH